jgi:isoleucyl-tRNA synthetase
LARELVRLVQDARKAAGLDITDRIALGIQTSGDLARAFSAHRDDIAGETLATSLSDELVADAAFSQETSIEGWPVTITLAKA